MHEKTGRIYHSNDQSFAFPVIVLSTIAGAANFAMGSVTQDPAIKNYIQLGLGGLSILTGIISTIGNRLAYASSSEAHRGASISWGKFNRLLVIELSLHPDERMEAFAFLKMFRIELDRLIEQSPSIPENVINMFIYEFKEYVDVKKPDITGDIEHTRVFSDNNSRLKRIAEETALTLNHKKGILKQLVLDDLESKIRKISSTVARRIYETGGVESPMSPVSQPIAVKPQKSSRFEKPPVIVSIAREITPQVPVDDFVIDFTGSGSSKPFSSPLTPVSSPPNELENEDKR
jgi:hypothetical protein